MTTRQEYAAAALQGMLAYGRNLASAEMATMAFIYADAMLAAERPENFSEQEKE